MHEYVAERNVMYKKKKKKKMMMMMEKMIEFPAL